LRAADDTRLEDVEVTALSALDAVQGEGALELALEREARAPLEREPRERQDVEPARQQHEVRHVT
jgi:hypothetical protein